MITSQELKKTFLKFFVERGHKTITSASLVPEGDASTLFISAGMHPLIPYLMGEPHPLGKRLCSVQKCLRTVDIEAVGDSYHHTFFEMLGNWSLGDYWKSEMIPWSYEFLTKKLHIESKKISVTCFSGDADAPRDEETAVFWEKVGIPKKRIYFLGKKDNWWGPPGETGPCGPDSEMFYDTGLASCGPDCKPGCDCGKYIEIWNDVFMQYNKNKEGKFEPLMQKNIDTGMGVDRTTNVLNGYFDNYLTDLFSPIVRRVEQISKKDYGNIDNQKAIRIIADHLRAAVFVIADGVLPSNNEQGYVLRRLIRRAVRFGRMIGILEPFTNEVAQTVFEIYGKDYSEITAGEETILKELAKEEEKFGKTLSKGIGEFNKLINKNQNLSGKDAFFLYETYGFPYELTLEMAQEKGLTINEDEFKKARSEHQQKSRLGAGQKFSGGLADHSEMVTKYHTATHLLHAALRQILGKDVHQEGSNITEERLRFDFSYNRPVTDKDLEAISSLVNQNIAENLPVKKEIMSYSDSQKKGALAFFKDRYPSKVSVYSIGDFSKEVCGGPHVTSTGVLGSFAITKEEGSGSGKRRIYAKLID